MIKTLHYNFIFWLENKTDGCFELDAESLTRKFIQWLSNQEQDWLEYYSCDTVIRYFLTGKKGINSTFKESQFPSIMHYLKPIYIQHTFHETVQEMVEANYPDHKF